MEILIESGLPAGWTGAVEGFGSFNVETSTTVALKGSRSLLLSAVGDATGYARAFRSFTTTIGAIYRVSGAYRLGGIANATAYSYVEALAQITDSGGNILDVDGRSFGAGGPFTLATRPDEWRRFVVDFRAIDTTHTLSIKLNVTTAAAATLHLDMIRLNRIWRFEHYEPRLQVDALPELKAGTSGVFFGPRTVSNTRVGIANGDGQLDRALGSLTWSNQEVDILVGGEGEDGNEVTIEDAFPQFSGFAQDQEWSEEAVSFTVESARFDFHRKLPISVYPESVIDTDLIGKAKPMFFGQKNGIRPGLVEFDTTYTKYGVYEIADCSVAPDGITAVDQVYAYEDDDAAANSDSTRRITLSEGTDYSVDLGQGRITILRDVGPYRVTEENRYLNFHIGAAELTATLTKGLYQAAALATHVTAQMTTAAGTAITCSYSESTNLFTVSKASGTLTLKVSSGTNKEASAWGLLGFARSGDQSAALSYSSGAAVFESALRQHRIYVNAQGYKDDTAGTYTGTPDALISLAPDIVACLAHRWLGQALPTDQSFTDARATCPVALSIYLREATSSLDIFQGIERSVRANVAVDGTGALKFIVNVGAAPATAKAIRPEHLLPGLRVLESSEEIFQTVQVQYNQHPVSGAWYSRSATDENVATEFRRGETLIVQTYLRIADNAETLAYQYLAMAQRKVQKVVVPTGPLLMGTEIGDVVRLTTERAPSSGGRFSNTAFRVLGYSKSAAAGTVTAELVEDAVATAGFSCVSNCQAVCELSAQDCAVTCEESCQISNCQTGCESNAQGCGISVCQETCQAALQGCGYTSCQTSCETSCQTTCELGAQTCTVGCETSCQVCGEGANCQTTCETNAQGCGFTTCEDACESTTQGCDSCQGGCQNTCESGAVCQDVCELACQTAAEYTCQNVCETVCQTRSETV
jgi:hypothetical protein